MKSPDNERFGSVEFARRGSKLACTNERDRSAVRPGWSSAQRRLEGQSRMQQCRMACGGDGAIATVSTASDVADIGCAASITVGATM
jgi:hypothetical protein